MKLLKIVFIFITASSLLAVENFRIRPNAPINNIKIPTFDHHGKKLWIFHGKKAHYKSEKEINVNNMLIEWFSSENQTSPETKVRSTFATLYPEDQKASGDGLITINGKTYTVIGEDWQWYGKQNKKNKHYDPFITINKNVNVKFF